MRYASGAVTAKRASSSPPPWRPCGQIPTPTRCRRWRNSRSWRCSRARPTPTGSPPRRSPSARPSTSAPASSPACSLPAGSTSAQLDRRPEAAAYLRESARLATQAGDNFRLGRALVNLADVLAVTDPAAAAEAARTAAGHLRRAGARDYLAVAIANLVQALLLLGDWDAAEQEFTQAVDSDGLADIEFLACQRGWLAALRGDAATAQTLLAALPDLRASEDPQDKAMVSTAEAFTAAARGQPPDALRHARATLARADALGISPEYLRWAWPLAARAAHELSDTAATRELLALLDDCQPGHLAPMLRAERDLARARLAAATATRPPPRPSPLRLPGCASSAPPTTSPMACSTTPST